MEVVVKRNRRRVPLSKVIHSKICDPASSSPPTSLEVPLRESSLSALSRTSAFQNSSHVTPLDDNCNALVTSVSDKAKAFDAAQQKLGNGMLPNDLFLRNVSSVETINVDHNNIFDKSSESVNNWIFEPDCIARKSAGGNSCAGKLRKKAKGLRKVNSSDRLSFDDAQLTSVSNQDVASSSRSNQLTDDAIRTSAPCECKCHDRRLQPSSTDSGASMSVENLTVDGTVADGAHNSMPNFKHSVSTLSLSNVVKPLLTKEAKERKHTLLVGSRGTSHWVHHLNSEEVERHFADRKMTILVGTWNVAGQNMNDRMLEEWFLSSSFEHLPDMYAIAVQEAPTGIIWSQWEIRIQCVIGPSHVLYFSSALGVQHLMVFVRREIIWFLSKPDTIRLSTRVVSQVKTKGAIAIAFYIFGTSILFVSCHLTASTGKLKERISDCLRISRNLRLLTDHYHLHRFVDVMSAFDYVFWFGDLNFRLKSTRAFVDGLVAKARIDVSATPAAIDYRPLLADDELLLLMHQGKLFVGFSEAVINFPPTYKYDLGTNTFDTSPKRRVPAYTDRIVYRQKREGTLSCVVYRDVPQICASDHKPVFGLFSVLVRPGKDKAPLSAGMFNVRVYEMGLQLRRRKQSITATSAILLPRQQAKTKEKSKLCVLS